MPLDSSASPQDIAAHGEGSTLQNNKNNNNNNNNNNSTRPPAPPVMASTTDELAKFSNESLHSYSFTNGTHDKTFVEGRRSIFYRSIDFMKQKIKGWQVPISNVFPHSASTTPTDNFSIGAYPSPTPSSIANFSEPTTNGEIQKPKLKRTMTDVPASTSTLQQVKERGNRPLSIATISTAGNYSSLHSPTRFVPQSQAMITTDQNWGIIMANDVSSLVFGYHGSELTTRTILDLVASPYKEKLEALLHQQMQDGSRDSKDEHVLLCGKVIRIQKRNSHSAAASVWLKQRKDANGQLLYIWVFEEISESVVSAVISSSGEILNIEGAVFDLYAYDYMELLGRSITTLIPALQKLQTVDPDTSFATLDVHQINVIKFFGARSKNGSTFPIICKVLNPSEHIDPEANPFNLDHDSMDGYLLRIISMPAIAGVITCHDSGLIQSANTVFTKYLFGYPATELNEKKSINDLIPQFQSILDKLLDEKDLSLDDDYVRLTEGAVVTATIIRRTAAEAPKPSILSPDFFAKPQDSNSNSTTGSPSITNKQSSAFKRNFGMSALLKRTNNAFVSNSGIVGLHRDGTPLDIDIQIRMIESPQGRMFAVWITYDRDISFTREPNRKPAPAPALTPSKSLSEAMEDLRSMVDSSTGSEQVVPDVSETKSDATTEDMQPPRTPKSGSLPNVKTSLNRHFSSDSASSPSSCASPASPAPSTPSSRLSIDNMKSQYSAVTKLHSIADYDILDSLGQGAYGQVKLCCLKGGSNKVVMKYIVKSRILVDCWTNDRILGMIPMEVSIMHTLRRIPHPNIVLMTDFFEDEEYYYVEMALHGAGMDLFDYIELTPYMTEDEIRGIFRQICDAVHHLHSNKIVHRDIKDENVILDQKGKIQLIDFGSSAYLKEGKKFDTFCGTLDYAAPEVLTGKKYEGRKQDIWALGILLYTLIYKENPFYNIDEILSRDLRVPFVLSEESIALIRWMLSRDIEKRPLIDDVLAHPWMTAPSKTPESSSTA
ncbi:Pkinase-domain-containing protein [Linnemannia elongata AG-77]|uniref:non-specific serine/threonine protein kinase n=1 Tax=Linnemannia elongata AG-77 TaxID=1314771 RepID=A0A197JXI4_9FUNG|nr:Pkinase-domain-containing protein [Linnemannia elongata AG-77]